MTAGKKRTMISKSKLHHAIITAVIDNGSYPDLSTLCRVLNTGKEEMSRALAELQEYHGIALHPDGTKVWAIHPFSLSPTNFIVQSKLKEWWGCCAWCSLGIAALLEEEVTIMTSIGAKQQEQVTLHIDNGNPRESSYLVHFPIPMKNVWDNVIDACSKILLFNNEEEIDEWTSRHDIPKGDVQPVQKIWNLSRDWYKDHLSPEWTKSTIEEAQSMFTKHQLSHPVWNLEGLNGRF